jgi:1,4-alpha-glucan branching enzyme
MDKGDSIEFRFGDQKKIKVGLMSVELDNWRSQIKQVNLAGDFNQWAPSNKAFVLQSIDNKIYKITIHKKLIGKKGEMHQFKFVLNEKYWIEPPTEASNKITGSDRNTNFYLKL